MAGVENQALAAWLERRLPDWQRFQSLLNQTRDSGDAGLADLVELFQRLRGLGRDLSLARATRPGTRLSRDLEGLFLSGRELIDRQPGDLISQLRLLFTRRIPAVMRELRGALIAVVSVFLLTALAGWLLVDSYPETVGLIASETMIATVQSGELWTDDLLNIMPSSILAVSIMTNNIMVSITAFVLGSLYGLGTLYIMALNGFMLGGIFAFVRQYDLHGRLFEFVIAHGVVELSVICVAGAAGVKLGEALARPGRRSRSEAFREAVGQAAILLPGIALLLVGAGIIEGYVSPDPGLSLATKLVVGLSYGFLMIMLLSGRLWRVGGGRLGGPHIP